MKGFGNRVVSGTVSSYTITGGEQDWARLPSVAHNVHHAVSLVAHAPLSCQCAGLSTHMGDIESDPATVGVV